MSKEIIQLGAKDFEDAIDFLNMVFGVHAPHDFENLLPAIYKPTDEWMGCNYAVRERGKIRAIVGMFPDRWKSGEAELKIAGIGGVSTHPKDRGAGYMKLLMSHCVNIMKEQGVHLSHLGGQRQRYQYFGYERCGLVDSFSLSRTNLRHTFPDDPGIRFVPIKREDVALIARAKELHDAQPAHSRRESASFHDYLKNWHCHPHAGLNTAGSMVGYLTASGRGDRINELVAESDEVAMRLIRAWTTNHADGDVSIEVPPWCVELLRSLDACSETAAVSQTDNWLILDWVPVIHALLGLRMMIGGLLDGAVAIKIEGYGTVEIEVSNGAARCVRGNATPDISLDPLTAARVLFGPRPPSHVTRIPSRALVMEQWCPLPLWRSHQDRV